MKFIKQFSLYTLTGVIGAGVNFIVMPVLSHYLSPADYGLLALFNTYITILIPLVSLLSNSILSIEYFKEKDKEIFASKFTSVQLVPLITSLPLLILVLLLYPRISDILELGGTSVIWGVIMVCITVFNIYSELFINFLVIEKKASLYFGYSVVKVLIEVGLTLYFVIYKHYDWQGRMYSWLITSTLFTFIGAYYFHKQRYLKGKFSWKFLHSGILFGLPLILHTIGKFVINQSDRLFIAKMISVDEAGIYNIGYTLGMMIMIVINAFFNFYSPFLLERLANLTDEKKMEIVRVNYFYIFAIVLLLLTITVLSPYFFYTFVDRRYWSGTRYVFWVGLGYVFWGGYMLFALYINYYDKNKILGWLAVFNVATNLIFNYFFIKWTGAIGAAMATALSFFLVFILVAYQANRLVPLPWFSFRSLFSSQRRIL